MNDPVYRMIGDATRGGIVAVCDHASNHVPAELDLGVSAKTLKKHVAYDLSLIHISEPTRPY